VKTVSDFACISAKPIFIVLESITDADSGNPDAEHISVNDNPEDPAGD
jgi:hypothetical protein